MSILTDYVKLIRVFVIIIKKKYYYWLVTKPDKEETARSIFEETAINITTEGRKHLGAALGSRSYLEQYANGKVEE